MMIRKTYTPVASTTMLRSFSSLIHAAIIFSLAWTSSALALPKRTPSTHTKPAAENTVNRRSVVAGSLLAFSSSVFAHPKLVKAEEEPAAPPKPSSSMLVGTYTDPINHPGGFRKIELTGIGFGGYELAKITGGGGRGEPESYELPAMIFECPGNRQALNRANSGKLCITIDFSPKGGPKDFTGFYDEEEKGIRFILDDNFWPKQ